MDYQKLQKLEKIYNFLIDNPKTTNYKISENLKLSNNSIRECIPELKKMGLKILIDKNHIQLHDSIDVIDPMYITNEIKKSGINKEIIIHFCTESTNRLAKTYQNDGIFICNYQSHGKGRQSKKWITPVGQSIAISISHSFKSGLQKLSGLNIAIGVAIVQTLNKYGRKNIGLKWPNDILDLHGKIAGILIEANGNNKNSKAIIGIGINWNIRHELFADIEQPCSNAEIRLVTRNKFIVELIRNVHKLIEEFSTNNLKNIQTQWQKHDIYLNKKINVIQGNSIMQAVYKGINKDGLLSIEIENKLKTVASGEVSIRGSNVSSSTN